MDFPTQDFTPTALEPIWPLPRRGGLSEADISERFEASPLWHYSYAFEGDLEFSARQYPNQAPDIATRPLKRFRHFMPWLQMAAGDFKGKRVLDIACNSGFWSIQLALLGADVVGFDARPELIEQANLLKEIVNPGSVQFQVLDFWSMSPEVLGGKFDVVLNLGILYHLPKPLEALERTKAMANSLVLIDTTLSGAQDASMRVRWEEPRDIRDAATAGVVMHPSKGAMELLLRHVGFSEWLEIPIRTDVPNDFIQGTRAAWLARV